MRHRKHGRTLGRHTHHRKALFRNMAASLFTHGQITTTIPKAKAVQPFVEKLITLAKKGDLHSRRLVISKLRDRIVVANDEDDNVQRNAYGEIIKQTSQPRLVAKLFDEIAPKYADRDGGCTRIIKLARHRIGDASDLCVLQLISDEDTGPQVGGKGVRRAKANKRMEFAAKVRKGIAGGQGQGQAEEEAAPAAEAGAEADTATAVAEDTAPEAQDTLAGTEDADTESTDGGEEEKKDV